jgi:hypothetical protein
MFWGEDSSSLGLGGITSVGVGGTGGTERGMSTPSEKLKHPTAINHGHTCFMTPPLLTRMPTGLLLE